MITSAEQIKTNCDNMPETLIETGARLFALQTAFEILNNTMQPIFKSLIEKHQPVVAERWTDGKPRRLGGEPITEWKDFWRTDERTHFEVIALELPVFYRELGFDIIQDPMTDNRFPGSYISPLLSLEGLIRSAEHKLMESIALCVLEWTTEEWVRLDQSYKNYNKFVEITKKSPMYAEIAKKVNERDFTELVEGIRKQHTPFAKK